MNFQGVHVASASLFKKDESLDLDRMRTHFEWLFQSGVDGLVPCGTTGESPTLDRIERNQLIKLATEIAKPKGKKVIPGCGGNDTKTSLTRVEEAAALGADAALVVTPYYNKPTQAGLIAHFTYLADRSPIPLILYNVPGRTAVNLQPETVVTLWAHPKIVGIKEASGQHSQWQTLAAQLNLREKVLLAGDDDAFATILAMGGAGIISASANVAPAHFVEIWKHAQAKQWDRAFALQTKLLPLVKAMFHGTNPSPTKYALSKMGKGENVLRLPLVPVQSETEKMIDSALQGLELT